MDYDVEEGEPRGGSSSGRVLEDHSGGSLRTSHDEKENPTPPGRSKTTSNSVSAPSPIATRKASQNAESSTDSFTTLNQIQTTCSYQSAQSRDPNSQTMNGRDDKNDGSGQAHSEENRRVRSCATTTAFPRRHHQARAAIITPSTTTRTSVTLTPSPASMVLPSSIRHGGRTSFPTIHEVIGEESLLLEERVNSEDGAECEQKGINEDAGSQAEDGEAFPLSPLQGVHDSPGSSSAKANVVSDLPEGGHDKFASGSASGAVAGPHRTKNAVAGVPEILKQQEDVEDVGQHVADLGVGHQQEGANPQVLVSTMGTGLEPAFQPLDPKHRGIMERGCTSDLERERDSKANGNGAGSTRRTKKALKTCKKHAPLGSWVRISGTEVCLVEYVGSGGSADVYRCVEEVAVAPTETAVSTVQGTCTSKSVQHDHYLSAIKYRYYALKIVFARDLAQLRALESEVSLLRELQSCEHVIRFFGAELDEKSLTILILLENGDQDLRTHLQERKAKAEMEREEVIEVVDDKDTSDEPQQRPLPHVVAGVYHEESNAVKMINTHDLLATTTESSSSSSSSVPTPTTLPLREVAALWQHMVDGVAEVHARDLVHFDVKPANFLLCNGRVKLADFGLARGFEDSERTHISRHRQCGTPGYMAPEAYWQPECGAGAMRLRPQADIWSLGIILYQLLFDRTPFEHLEQCGRRLHFAVADPRVEIIFPDSKRYRAEDPRLFGHLSHLLQRCLQRDWRKRWTSQRLRKELARIDVHMEKTPNVSIRAVLGPRSMSKSGGLASTTAGTSTLVGSNVSTGAVASWNLPNRHVGQPSVVLPNMIHHTPISVAQPLFLQPTSSGGFSGVTKRAQLRGNQQQDQMNVRQQQNGSETTTSLKSLNGTTATGNCEVSTTGEGLMSSKRISRCDLLPCPSTLLPEDGLQGECFGAKHDSTKSLTPVAGNNGGNGTVSTSSRKRSSSSRQGSSRQMSSNILPSSSCSSVRLVPSPPADFIAGGPLLPRRGSHSEATSDESDDDETDQNHRETGSSTLDSDLVPISRSEIYGSSCRNMQLPAGLYSFSRFVEHGEQQPLLVDEAAEKEGGEDGERQPLLVQASSTIATVDKEALNRSSWRRRTIWIVGGVVAAVAVCGGGVIALAFGPRKASSNSPREEQNSNNSSSRSSPSEASSSSRNVNSSSSANALVSPNYQNPSSGVSAVGNGQFLGRGGSSPAGTNVGGSAFSGGSGSFS
ncbi:unnamed protein product, partial [Amoebophrya sp. A25]|eukprot:GSA25T00018443001.1